MLYTQYGRKWQVLIVAVNGASYEIKQDSFWPEGLKIQFEINYPGYEGWYFSDIIIWNLSETTANNIMQEPIEGAKLYLSAGYQDGKFGQIFGGSIFQCLLDRESVVDYKLTIRAIDGDRLFDNNLANFTLRSEYTQMSLMNAATINAQKKMTLGFVSPSIQSNNEQSPRPYTGFAPACVITREWSRYNSAQMFYKDDKLNFVTANDSPDPAPTATTKVIVKSPTTGLIGTPQHIDYGVNFRCLLDPQIQLTAPPSWIRLDMSAIKMQKIAPGQRSSVLDQRGQFKIGGVRHSGDTRGNDWYTDVVGYSISGKGPLKLTPSDILPVPIRTVSGG